MVCNSLQTSLHSRPQSLRSFWPAAGIESSGSNHFETTKEITEFCPSGFMQSASMAHAWTGCSQSSRFLPQVRRIIGSGDENDVSAKSKNCSLLEISRIETRILMAWWLACLETWLQSNFKGIHVSNLLEMLATKTHNKMSLVSQKQLKYDTRYSPRETCFNVGVCPYSTHR